MKSRQSSLIVIGKHDSASSAQIITIFKQNASNPEANIYRELKPHEAAYHYSESDNIAHDLYPDLLLYFSDIMADDINGQFDLLAAEARLEYLLKVDDPQALDHEQIALALLNNKVMHQIESVEFHHSTLLSIYLPLFRLIKHRSINAELLTEVQFELLLAIEKLTCAIDNTQDDNIKSKLAGYANELAILAILMNNKSLDFIALPAFTHQDMYRTSYYCSESPDYGSKCKAYDIAIYNNGSSDITYKIQVKTSKEQITGKLEHDDDIKLVYAREIAEEYMALYKHKTTRPELFRLIVSDYSDNTLNNLSTILNKYIHSQNTIIIPKPRLPISLELLDNAS